MKITFAFVFYPLLLIVFSDFECRAISKERSFLSKVINNNTSPEDVTLNKDTSNFNNYMTLMNFTKFIKSKEATTNRSVTDEAEYYEWAEKWPRFLYDDITSPTFTTPGGGNSSILDALYFYEIYESLPQNFTERYLGNQKEFESTLNIKGWEPLTTQTFDLTPYKHIQTSYNDSEMDGSINHYTSSIVSLENQISENHTQDIEIDILSPPWMKYELMQLKDEMGQNVVPYNLSDRPTIKYQFPLARDRWWWEYEKHYMHWYFWHCQHWMTYWVIDPPVSPNPPLTNNHTYDKQEHYKDGGKYRKDREYFFYNYCNWLLQANTTNLEDSDTVIDTFINSVDGNTIQSANKYERRRKDVKVAECYVCGIYFDRYHLPIKGHLCHRAFTHPKYFKFQNALRGICYNVDISHYEFEIIGSFFNFYGKMFHNSCIWFYTDIGELHTERGCRRKNYAGYFKRYPRNIYNVLDLFKIKVDTATGCVASPYSTYIPFSRSGLGLFVRAYACVCQGSYCNLGNRLSHSSVLYTYLFTLVIYKSVKLCYQN